MWPKPWSTYVNEVDATQLVLGKTRRSWLRARFSGSVVRNVLRLAGNLDVHLVTDTADDREH